MPLPPVGDLEALVHGVRAFRDASDQQASGTGIGFPRKIGFGKVQAQVITLQNAVEPSNVKENTDGYADRFVGRSTAVSAEKMQYSL